MKLIDPHHLDESAFRLIDKDWMLITAGNPGNFNTMTASWGGLGIIWNKPVAYIFVRPTRYTFQFLEANDWFTLCFFGAGYRRALNFCGTRSGRDTDKIAETGLIPQETTNGNIWFQQARLVFECRKLYYQDLNPDNFLDSKIGANYPIKDYHRMYFGKIENTWLKEDNQ